MVGILATLKIKAGTCSAFEAVANQLVQKVNDNEKGVVYYDLYKQDETTYIFFERYTDTTAKDAHGKTDYFKEIGAKMGAFLIAKPEIKVLESVKI